MEFLDRSQLATAMSSFLSSFSSAADGIHDGHVEDDTSFDLTDYIHVGDEAPPAAAAIDFPEASADLMARNFEQPAIADNMNIRDDELQPLMKEERYGHRVAFRTQTEVDILDDGFKWRKYGKKSVKNRPNNPRNYYRCSSERCPVKKRVERDQEEPNYVITTYIGAHNHASPVVRYTAHDSGSGI